MVGFAGVIGFLFINYLLLNALRQPVVFSGLTAQEALLLEEVQAPVEAALSPSASPSDPALIERLERHMRENKPHLDSNLTVGQLARELSRLFNQGFNKNFFEFISAYRIEEAKLRLQDPANTDSILDVMYQAGFNSKSVFNTLFKGTTGMTPSQYRTAHRRTAS